MKTILLSLFISVSLYSQNNEAELHKTVFANNVIFLDKPLKKVEAYWSTKISALYIKKTLGEGGGEINIMYGDAGNPDFSAVFANGGCVLQSLIMYSKEVSIFQAKLTQLGFVLNKKDNFWRLKSKKYICRIEKIGGMASNVFQADIGFED